MPVAQPFTALDGWATTGCPTVVPSESDLKQEFSDADEDHLLVPCTIQEWFRICWTLHRILDTSYSFSASWPDFIFTDVGSIDPPQEPGGSGSISGTNNLNFTPPGWNDLDFEDIEPYQRVCGDYSSVLTAFANDLPIEVREFYFCEDTEKTFLAFQSVTVPVGYSEIVDVFGFPSINFCECFPGGPPYGYGEISINVSLYINSSKEETGTTTGYDNALFDCVLGESEIEDYAVDCIIAYTDIKTKVAESTVTFQGTELPAIPFFMYGTTEQMSVGFSPGLVSPIVLECEFWTFS